MNSTKQLFYSQLTLLGLMDFFVSQHHSYYHQGIMIIDRQLKKALKNKESNSSILGNISHYFEDFRNILEQHLRKEKTIFFPFVNKLLKEVELKKTSLLSQVPLLDNPINILKGEHSKMLHLLSDIKHVTNDYYVNPDIKDKSLNDCYLYLKEFTKEFNKHIFMEEKFMFPKMLDLQTSSSKEYVLN